MGPWMRSRDSASANEEPPQTIRGDDQDHLPNLSRTTCFLTYPFSTSNPLHSPFDTPLLDVSPFLQSLTTYPPSHGQGITPPHASTSRTTLPSSSALEWRRSWTQLVEGGGRVGEREQRCLEVAVRRRQAGHLRLGVEEGRGGRDMDQRTRTGLRGAGFGDLPADVGDGSEERGESSISFLSFAFLLDPVSLFSKLKLFLTNTPFLMFASRSSERNPISHPPRLDKSSLVDSSSNASRRATTSPSCEGRRKRGRRRGGGRELRCLGGCRFRVGRRRGCFEGIEEMKSDGRGGGDWCHFESY